MLTACFNGVWEPMNSVPSKSLWLPYQAVAIRLRSRVWLMFKPQNLRASSHRPYDAFVRKTSRRPSDGDRIVNGVKGRPSWVIPFKIGSYMVPDKSWYPPVKRFQAQTKVAIPHVAKISFPIFL